MGGESSFHDQAKSKFKIFSECRGRGSMSRPNLKFDRPNLNFKILGESGGGVSHLSMTRPNLKFDRPNLNFKFFGESGGGSSFHDQAKSEI